MYINSKNFFGNYELVLVKSVTAIIALGVNYVINEM